VISIVHYYEDFTLENANIVFNILQDNLFTARNSQTNYDFQAEQKPETYSIIADMDVNITMRLAEAASKNSEEEFIEWLLFAEQVRRK